MGQDAIRWDIIGYYGNGWDTIRWERMGWGGVGWDWMGCVILPSATYNILIFQRRPSGLSKKRSVSFYDLCHNSFSGECDIIFSR